MRSGCLPPCGARPTEKASWRRRIRRSINCAGRWVLPAAKREAVFHPEFRQDLRFWVENDRKVALRTFELIEAVLRDPFAGLGKPELLKFVLAGCWSRRITQEH